MLEFAILSLLLSTHFAVTTVRFFDEAARDISPC
jgi:hypothetical protein